MVFLSILIEHYLKCLGFHLDLLEAWNELHEEYLLAVARHLLETDLLYLATNLFVPIILNERISF